MKAFKIETSTVPVIENMRQNLLFLNPDFNQRAFIGLVFTVVRGLKFCEKVWRKYLIVFIS